MKTLGNKIKKVTLTEIVMAVIATCIITGLVVVIISLVSGVKPYGI